MKQPPAHWGNTHATMESAAALSPTFSPPPPPKGAGGGRGTAQKGIAKDTKRDCKECRMLTPETGQYSMPLSYNLHGLRGRPSYDLRLIRQFVHGDEKTRAGCVRVFQAISPAIRPTILRTMSMYARLPGTLHRNPTRSVVNCMLSPERQSVNRKELIRPPRLQARR